MKKYNFDNPVHCARYVARYPHSMVGGRVNTDGSVTFPSYENILITEDGEYLCSDCVRKNYKEIISDTKYDYGTQCAALSVVSESELENQRCSHCYKQIGYQEEED